MENIENNKETIESIDILIVNAIEEIKTKKKRSDESAIVEYLQKRDII